VHRATPPPASAEESAAREFRDGIHAVGGGDLAGALGAFHRACAHAPEVPRYQLYRAWARYQVSTAAADPRENPLAVRDSCRATIIEALRADPRFDAGYVLLGSILLGEGDVARARLSFLKALSLNPANAGAQMGIDSCAELG